MINIAVIDDEKVVRDQVVDKVNAHIQGYDAKVFAYSSATSFFNSMCKGTCFHIVVSDIRMQEMDGIEMGKRLKEVCPNVCLIYLTASKDFAVASYMLDAFQYVLKCEIDTRFPEILQAALKRVDTKLRSYVVVRNGSELQKLSFADIIYIQKVKGTKYVEYITETECFYDRKTLEQVMVDARKNQFVLVERGHAANLRHVVKIKDNVLTLSNGEELEVSRTRIQGVRDALNRYWELN